MKLIFSLLVLYLNFSSVLTRGADRSLFSTSFSGSTRHLFEGNPSETSFDKAKGHVTNAELEKAVKEFRQRCSNISRICCIGKSVSGFPLWVIEILDKPGVEEPEPPFKFIGNVHGDEPVGRELLILLANWICDNHVKDSLARLIVENMHLHILPSMNPDGYALKRRGNANNIDLNRDFPDQFFPMNNDEEACQPETRAIMSWVRQIHFTASASLHGGALVANYPWDGTQDKRRYYYGCPDDEAFQFLASVYSRSHYNMSLSTEFQGGIINGASWYPIYGGMQDWNYIYGGCFELTLEISDDKWPSAEELPTIWEYNKMSMLNLVASLVKTGVRGRIFSSDSGRPLPGSITIKGINYTVNAGRAFADYYRLLTPGKRYEVMASMPGYKPKSTSIWLEETATADFILDPDSALEDNTPRSICDCSCDSKAKLVLLEFLLGFHVEVCFVLIVIGALLCFLLKRRQKFTLGKHKQSPKRSVVV
ncbi:carboxypeptidase SOL1 isoform X7 [Citrus sinensis]|uniref:carboxypeptidase SOL1 isoform X7 n=1 Tax=Citrus sinensis TaxID=2711 RepID=UPI0022790575|nr:carboxypeptidase SOL1 isoform X7 [Citrus sinensis]